MSAKPKLKKNKISTRKRYQQRETDESWKCRGCGKCCEYLPFKASPGRDRDHDVFWGVWGMETFNYKGWQYIKVHQPCQHLTEDKKCSIYDVRPMRCRQAECLPWAGICPDEMLT